MAAVTEQDAVARAWLEYRQQPGLFCLEMLNSPNDPWQDAALRHMVPGSPYDRLLIASCHGTGKTHYAVKLLLHAGTTWGRVRIPCAAPKEDTLKDRMWPEISKVLRGADPFLRQFVDWQKTKVSFDNSPGHEALIETAAKTEGMAGHHENIVLAIIEEATGVEDEMWPVIEGWLTTEGSKLLAITNPTRTTGVFAKGFRKPDARTKLMRIAWNPSGLLELGIDADDPNTLETRDSSRPYYELNETGSKVEVWYSDRPDDAWARTIVLREGWDSDICRVRVRGLQPTSDENALVSAEQVWAAYGREPAVNPTGERMIWTWDVAGAGRDRSVLSQRRGDLVDWIHISNQKNTAFAVDEILEEVRGLEEKPHELMVDVIGLGVGPVDQITARGFNPTPVNVGKPTQIEDDSTDEYSTETEYANLRAMYYWRLRKDFREGRICISKSVPENLISTLAEELESTAWKHNLSGAIQMISKDEIKKRLGRSPDLADALMMFYAGPEGHHTFEAFGDMETSRADW